jgi:hypothetical protein
MRSRVLVLVALAACASEPAPQPACDACAPDEYPQHAYRSDECSCAPKAWLPKCGDLACVGISCGNLTPEGDTNADICACAVGDDVLTCVLEPL